MTEFPEEFVWFELIEFDEPSANGLRIVIAESITRSATLDAEGPVSGVSPMTVGPDSRVFEIHWDYTAAYSISNESYVSFVEDEVALSKSAVREHVESRYLTYIRSRTFAEAIHGPLRHWYVGCQNHCIDVAAWKEPVIRHLENYKFPDWV